MSWIFNPADPHAAPVRMGLGRWDVSPWGGDRSPAFPPFFRITPLQASTPPRPWGELLSGPLVCRVLDTRDMADSAESTPFWYSLIMDLGWELWRLSLTYNVSTVDVDQPGPFGSSVFVSIPARSWAVWLYPEDPARGLRIWYNPPTMDLPFGSDFEAFNPLGRNRQWLTLYAPPRPDYEQQLQTLSDELLVEAAWP